MLSNNPKSNIFGMIRSKVDVLIMTEQIALTACLEFICLLRVFQKKRRYEIRLRLIKLHNQQRILQILPESIILSLLDGSVDLTFG